MLQNWYETQIKWAINRRQLCAAGASNCSWESLLTRAYLLTSTRAKNGYWAERPLYRPIARDDIAAGVVCQSARMVLQKMLSCHWPVSKLSERSWRCKSNTTTAIYNDSYCVTAMVCFSDSTGVTASQCLSCDVEK